MIILYKEKVIYHFIYLDVFEKKCHFYKRKTRVIYYFVKIMSNFDEELDFGDLRYV